MKKRTKTTSHHPLATGAAAVFGVAFTLASNAHKHPTPPRQAQRAAPSFARSPGAIEGAQGGPRSGAKASSRSPQPPPVAGLGGADGHKSRSESDRDLSAAPAVRWPLGGETPHAAATRQPPVQPRQSGVRRRSLSRRAKRVRKAATPASAGGGGFAALRTWRRSRHARRRGLPRSGGVPGKERSDAQPKAKVCMGCGGGASSAAPLKPASRLRSAARSEATGHRGGTPAPHHTQPSPSRRHDTDGKTPSPESRAPIRRPNHGGGRIFGGRNAPVSRMRRPMFHNTLRGPIRPWP